MQNNDNQKTYFIYVRSTGKKVPVTKTQHDSFYKEADRIRHKEQDHGRCMCPYRFISGMTLYALSDNVRTFAPIVHDIVDVSDKRKMSYRQEYVEDDTQFSLRKSYTISGGTERNLNRGRMDSLTISTADFDSLTCIVINPFVTEPFINGRILPARVLTDTAYTIHENGSMKLKTEYAEIIEGEAAEIDRGRLAVYPLGLTAFETITELEVQSG